MASTSAPVRGADATVANVADEDLSCMIVETVAPTARSGSAGPPPARIPAQPAGSGQKRVLCTICGSRHQRRGCLTLKCGHSFGVDCFVGLKKPAAKAGWSQCDCPTCKTELQWFDRYIMVGHNAHARDGKAHATGAGSSRKAPRKKAGAKAGAADPDGGRVNMKEADALLKRVDKLSEATTAKSGSKKRAKTSKAKAGHGAQAAQTAWSKGTGFGGAKGNNAGGAAVAQAHKREAKQDKDIVAVLSDLTAYLAGVSGEAGTAQTLALQYMLESSTLVALLSSLLRNDSLMDITGNRPALYLELAGVVEALALEPAFCGVLDGACQIKAAVKALNTSADKAPNTPDMAGKGKGQTRGRRGKRPAAELVSEDESGDEDEDGATTGLDFLMAQIGRQCKLFIKQCGTAASSSGGGLKSMDPKGVATKLLELNMLVKERVAARDPTLRVVAAPKTASAAGSAGSASAASSALEEEYLASMKVLQFRMVKVDHTVHHYNREIVQSASMAMKRDRLKRITREMSSLSSSLPLNFSSSIFLRVSEDRPDVLKALIIGPEGTPYENGCFVFDIFLPANYPQEPPKVNLLTTGQGKVRFNPNLYACGKVCLSLLGTWDGPGWLPATSTLLQVLLSIQSLILVDEPYFNEPGFEARPNAKTMCTEYNQSLQYHTMSVAMVDGLSNTCNELKSVVQTHFRLKKDAILQQCKKWAADAISKPPPKPHTYWGGSGHHQVAFATPQQLATMVATLESKLSTLHVESSITVV